MSVLLLESLHPDAEALLAAGHEVVRAADPNAPACDFDAVQAILILTTNYIITELFFST